MMGNPQTGRVDWGTALANSGRACLVVAVFAGPVFCFFAGLGAGLAMTGLTGRLENLSIFPTFIAVCAALVGAAGSAIFGIPASAILQRCGVAGMLPYGLIGGLGALVLVVIVWQSLTMADIRMDGIAFGAYVVLHGVAYASLFQRALVWMTKEDARVEEARLIDASRRSA